MEKVGVVLEVYTTMKDYAVDTFSIDRDKMDNVITQSAEEYKDIEGRKIELLSSIKGNVEEIKTLKYREVVINYLALIDEVKTAMKDNAGKSMGIYLQKKIDKVEVGVLDEGDFKKFLNELPKEYFK